MDVVLADPLVVALILGAAGMPATGALVCKRWREALEYSEAWIGLEDGQKENALMVVCAAGDLVLVRRRIALLDIDASRHAEKMLELASGGESANLALVQWIACAFEVSDDAIADALYCACVDGNLPVVQWLVEHYDIDYDWILRDEKIHIVAACADGRLDVAKWLTATFGITHLPDDAFQDACCGGHLATVKWMAATFDISRLDAYYNWGKALYKSCERGHRDVALWFIARFGLTDELLGRLRKHDGTVSAAWLVDKLGLDCPATAEHILAKVLSL
jgi:hypothetical protein